MEIASWAAPAYAWRCPVYAHSAAHMHSGILMPLNRVGICTVQTKNPLRDYFPAAVLLARMCDARIPATSSQATLSQVNVGGG